MPPGVFNMVVGTGPEVGEAMVHAHALRAISFTGSNRVGGELYVKAAQRGAKVTCEMGGKNAVIVMPDADLDKAAAAIHGGAFGSTGQRCTATSRVIAHPDIKRALVERLVASAQTHQGRARARHDDGHGAVDCGQAVVHGDGLHRDRQAGRRDAPHRRHAPGPSRAGLLHRPDDLRRCRSGDADLQGRDLRAGAVGGRGLDPGRGADRRPTASSTASPRRSSRKTSPR